MQQVLAGEQGQVGVVGQAGPPLFDAGERQRWWFEFTQPGEGGCEADEVGGAGGEVGGAAGEVVESEQVPAGGVEVLAQPGCDPGGVGCDGGFATQAADTGMVVSHAFDEYGGVGCVQHGGERGVQTCGDRFEMTDFADLGGDRGARRRG
ncbi:hypothetical protein AB0F52_32620 [Amycolatopsis sp. NPDC024027]|uniref:hypothetical protein n=1 Tax=Amycolatopsis sp. NPDC024027 TaxID=3154327 RepID=UPI0033C6BC97